MGEQIRRVYLVGREHAEAFIEEYRGKPFPGDGALPWNGLAARPDMICRQSSQTARVPDQVEVELVWDSAPIPQGV